MINYLKVGFIWIADTINRMYYPFKKVSYLYTESLAEDERLFSHQLATSFVDNGRFKYQVPMPADEGDAALYQGIYCAMINLKYPDACAEVQQANQALGGFFRDGILIRGIRNDGTVNDTTSNDSGTGMLFGLYHIWCRSTWEADSAIQRWADCIIDSGYALTDLSGKPTQYGQLEDGIKTDPLRLTLLLGVLALAARVAGTKYQVHYDKLYKKHYPLMKYPKVKLLWWDTDYDTQRAAMHLYVLYNLTGDKVYADGLGRTARITDAENNAFVQTLCWPFNGLEVDLSILRTFNLLTRLNGNVAVQNSVPTVKWGNHERATMALPIEQRGSQEFFWSRNMFSVNEWAGNATAGVHHSMLDFLIVYWMAVRLKLLK